MYKLGQRPLPAGLGDRQHQHAKRSGGFTRSDRLPNLEGKESDAVIANAAARLSGLEHPSLPPIMHVCERSTNVDRMVEAAAR